MHLITFDHKKICDDIFIYLEAIAFQHNKVTVWCNQNNLHKLKIDNQNKSVLDQYITGLTEIIIDLEWGNKNVFVLVSFGHEWE